MRSIFETGEKLLAAAFSFAAVAIDYRRAGEIVAVSIPAKLGKTLFRVDNYGVSVRIRQRDFIVRTADLAVTPEVGDEILFDGKIYSVTAPADEPCWQWHTRLSHDQRRIHAKFSGDNQE